MNNVDDKKIMTPIKCNNSRQSRVQGMRVNRYVPLFCAYYIDQNIMIWNIMITLIWDVFNYTYFLCIKI